MDKIKELEQLNKAYRSAKSAYEKAMAEQLAIMKANGVDKVEAEDGTCYVLIVRTKETQMPAYTRKASEYLRIF